MTEKPEAQDFKRIGSLLPKISPMPADRASTMMRSAAKPKNSATTGSPNQDATPQSVIGALRGGTGALERLNLAPAYSKPVAEPVEERAWRLMNNSLNRQGGPSRSDLTHADALVKELSPTGDERDVTVMTMLTTFFHHFPRQRLDPAVEPAVLNDWLDDLAGFPVYSIRLALVVCRRRAGEWLPPVSDVIRWAGVYSREYRRMRQSLERFNGNQSSDKPREGCVP